MKKNYSLILIAFFCFVFSGYAQYNVDFEDDTKTAYASGTVTLNSINWNMTEALIGTASNDFKNGLRSARLRGRNGSGITMLANKANGIGTVSFEYRRYGSDTGQQPWAVEYSTNDGANWTQIGSTFTATATVQTFSSTVNVTGNIRLRIVLTTTPGTTGNRRVNVDDISITDHTITCTDAVDFGNIQAPTTMQTITVGNTFDVYAQVYEPGVTDTPFSQGAGIDAWIGYSSTNNNPSSAGWTWVPATYNDIGGNNDEYQVDLGAAITVPGTYYFASRFELNSCGYVYGGTGGIWNNDSVELLVEPDQVNFCNVDFPKTATITVGDNHNVYAQAYEPGVTDAAGQGANLLAWIGYNTTDNDPSVGAGWTWVAATYDSDFGNNDQYVAEIGSSLPVGTYYYASRFQLNGSDYSYGGIQADNVGNFWDATVNNSGILIINNPPAADVVITEIMYNTPTPGTDYEWIEICNLNGTAEDISNYTVDVNGTVRHTFPASTSIPANSCITVLIGQGSSAPECPFTPDYGAPSGTNFLPNGGALIELVAPNTVSISDSVLYDEVDSVPTDGNGSSFHVIDATMDNADTGNGNWQAVIDGGSPGDNTLISPCTAPELQLVDNSNTDQDCGSFTIDYGVQAIGFDTDITFDIDNDGTIGLDISAMTLGGTNPGDYSIVSPATPFTVAAGGTQTVTVRFNTSNLGASSATLTIASNDSDEGSCVVDLAGTGISPAPNIIVRGVIGSNPTIPNGSTGTSSLNNTLFAQQTISTTQQTKTFRIGNEGGTADLTVSGITLSGDTADFFVTSSFTNPFAANTTQDFTITFQPTTLSGFRSVTVSIANTDSNKDPYTFVVGGTANCPSVSGTIAPLEGPPGTTVTILSPGNDLTGATATLNGVALDPISDSTNELVVRLPNSVTTGGPLSVQLTTGCIFSNTFTLLDDTISGCEASTSATVSDLFISEVTDSPSGSLTYVELYNATGATINFGTTNYSLVLYNNGNTTNPKTLVLNSGSVANNSTYVISMGIGSTSSQCSVTGGDGSLAQADQSQPGASINFFKDVSGVDNPNLGHDFISINSPAAVSMANPDGIVDTWGTLGDETWATGLGLGTKGANFQRETSSVIPNSSTVFVPSAWLIQDWNDADCSDVDYSTIGAYDFSTGVAPTVTLQPVDPVFNCNFSASITIGGAEGFDEASDTQELAYRWFVNAPGSTTWNEILPANTNYTGQQTTTLNILDTSNLDRNQYYCQIREDDAACYVATRAVILNVLKSEWDGTNWSDPPANDRIAIINGDYDTSVGTNGQTSFEACRLIINSTYTLSIENNTYVRVQNDLTVDGELIVKTDGSFVQVNDAAIVDGAVLTTRSKISVEKETAFLATYQEYTYWSSPVSGELVNDGLAEASPTRRFWYNAQNFRDSTQETNNDNTAVAGQDDIDDDGNDWADATGPTIVMEPGVGYASTHHGLGFVGPAQYIYTFNGPFNNGVINVPVYRNDAETNDNNWNFIGNPYPSAVSADLFLAANGSIDQTVGATNGAIFFWSHNTPADGNTNGNQVLNYSQSDYAIINGTGQTAGGDGVVPDRFIPSGQGFFVSMDDAAASTSAGGTIRTTDVIFNNSMRVTGNNAQFFRTASSAIPNKIRLDLTSDNGVFNQILVGYVQGATNDDDGMYYDAHKTLSTNANAVLYSLINGSGDRKFAIQGKAPSTLTLEEVIPLGFYTIIDEATIYTLSIAELEGDFMNENTVYLKDNLLDVVHDLSANDYVFTSEVGEFNARFEIVFQAEALSVNENDIDSSELIIVEQGDGDVKFSVGNSLIIKHIDIIDSVGRLIYQLSGNNNVEVYNLSRLSQSAYIARVTLSNGQTITKKAIKRK